MKNSVKNAIAGVVLLSAGYVCGAYLGLPQQNSDLNSGNISKAATAMQYQQMISKNPNAQSEASSVLTIMNKKTEQFSQLTSATIAALKDIPELSEILDEISEYKSLAERASDSEKAALEAFGKLSGENGAEEAANYVMTTQEAILNYMMVNSSENAANDVVSAIDYYLHQQGDDNGNKNLSAIRDMWVNYLKLSAVMNGNKTEAENLNRMKALLSDKDLASRNELQNAVNANAEIVKYTARLADKGAQMKHVAAAFANPDKMNEILGVQSSGNYAHR